MSEFCYKDKVVRYPNYAHGYYRGFWERGVFYEQKMLEHISSVSSDGVFVDVGANTGNHSLYFSMLCPAQEVFSFEPNIEHHKAFVELMNLNNVRNVRLFPFALSDQDGVAEVTYVINKSTPNRTSIDKCSTLDGALEINKNKVSIIKIDVEGYEIKVLKGATSTLRESNARLYIECIGQSEFQAVERFLKYYDYKYTGVYFNHTPTYEFIKISK